MIDRPSQDGCLPEADLEFRALLGTSLPGARLVGSARVAAMLHMRFEAEGREQGGSAPGPVCAADSRIEVGS